MNTMTIGDFQAVIAFDPDIQLFRGEFVGLNGGADFYAADVKGLKAEGEITLRVFLEACEQRGIEPRKHFSGNPRGGDNCRRCSGAEPEPMGDRSHPAGRFDPLRFGELVSMTSSVK